MACGFSIRAQEAQEQKKPDLFFSGTVTERAADKISVSRRISGKQEKRTFKLTPETKVEGKLQLHVRVTVQYTDDDEGGTATRVVVHSAPKK